MDITTALIIKKRSLGAIAELDGTVSDLRNSCTEEELQAIRIQVGRVISYVYSDLLEPALREFPEIDDLK
jgi:type VI protein secretion system component VasF